MSRRGRLFAPATVRDQSRWRPLSRRTLLRGVLGGGAVFVGLPFLEAMGSRAYACGGIIPRRFGLFYWGNGNLPVNWTPTGEGTEWELSEQLAPLAGVKDVISVISGYSVKLPNNYPHTSGACGLLSAAPPTTVGSDTTYSAPTINQVIANAIGQENLYHSVQTAAIEINGQSYTGPSARNPPDFDPHAFYERLFGASFREPGSESVVDPTLAN